MKTEIVIDTETTGLVGPDGLPLVKQPYITELFAYKIESGSCEIIDEYHSLFHVPLPLSDLIIELTGITDELLEDAPEFVEQYQELANFCLGVTRWVAHNAVFDMSMVKFELMRIGKEFLFPWPIEQYCTSDHAIPIHGRRMKQVELYEFVTGNKPGKAHRAKEDVEMLLTNYKYLLEHGL